MGKRGGAREGAGRPVKQIDKDQFEKLCELQCSEQEIAFYFRCSVETLNKWCHRVYEDEQGNSIGFKEVFAIYRQGGFISLRHRNWRSIKDGNTALQIFYSKNYLNMSDNPNPSSDEKQTINFNITRVQDKKEVVHTNNDEWIDDEDEWGDLDEWGNC